MTSTATHTLAGVQLLEKTGEYVAWCSCNIGFWGETESLAWGAWEAHVDRIVSIPRSDVDEADLEQYDREEDQRLEQQLGAWHRSPRNSGASER